MIFCTVEKNKAANYKYLMKLAKQQKAIKGEKSTGNFFLDYMIENAVTEKGNKRTILRSDLVVQ